MKKYVKPMMECEEFVANEYVATCYGITGSGVVLTKLPTDGNSNTGSWNNQGFSDDGFDILSSKQKLDGKPATDKFYNFGQIDQDQYRGWYCTTDSFKKYVHPKTKDKAFYCGDNLSLGSVSGNDMSTGVYFIGKDDSPVSTAIEPIAGVGPNAS